MIEENMLRGSLVTSNEAKGGLGFKGERGYSNYEMYVKNGGTMTEQEWLDHFGVDLTGYAKTSEVDAKDNAIKADLGDIEELTTIDKTNVVSAINEHQSSIEALDDRGLYSTTEKVIGTWIDGKPIYRKVVYFGALPNATIKRVAHNIQNIDFATNIYAVSKRVQSGVTTWGFIPYVRTTALEQMGIWLEDGNIAIQTGIDRTTFTETYVIIEYTKTTD